ALNFLDTRCAPSLTSLLQNQVASVEADYEPDLKECVLVDLRRSITAKFTCDPVSHKPHGIVGGAHIVSVRYGRTRRALVHTSSTTNLYNHEVHGQSLVGIDVSDEHRSPLRAIWTARNCRTKARI